MSNNYDCRVCLHSRDNMKSIFGSVNCFKISTKICYLAQINIQPNDGLSSFICTECIGSLKRCVKFIQKCIDSDLKSRSLQANNQDYIKNFNSNKDQIVLSENNLEKRHLSSKRSNGNKLTENEIARHDSIHISVNFKKRKKHKQQQCSVCGKIISSIFRLKTHLTTHSGEKTHICTKCDKKFSTAQNLKIHFRRHTGEKPLQCSICGQRFAHTSGLAVHVRKHTEDKPFACTLCPCNFFTAGHLKYHLRRHMGETNFACEQCGRGFLTRGLLNQHLLSHKTAKPYVCDFCGKCMDRATQLQRHKRRVHGAIKEIEVKEKDN